MSDNVSTLMGILVDVSGSMKSSVGHNFQHEQGAWIRSVFEVVDDLITNDVSASNHVFAVGFGASCRGGIFDLISTLDKVQKEALPKNNNMQLRDVIDSALYILESNGAPSVRKWASVNDIEKVVSEEKANLILHQLKSDKHFVTFVVDMCLPSACKGFVPRSFENNDLLSLIFKGGINICESGFTFVRRASKSEIEDVIEKAHREMGKNLQMVSVTRSFYSVKEASRILHGCIDESILTETRIEELLDKVKPYIYGKTPMFGALNQTRELFSSSRYRDFNKLLFILSDGVPTDQGRKEELFSFFNQTHVHVVSCFITDSTQVESKRLFSAKNYNWDDGAKFLFDLSSNISTQLLPRTIFLKRQWKIDIDNNETRMFIQVNHPDHIRDACDLARNVVCCQDALADILTSVSLDLYINQYIGALPAPEQVGGTCYANASATVLHLSMKRVLGRSDGYPDFDVLRQDLIRRYGENGANTFSVLENVCPQYRLHCLEVDIMGALRAITAKRPVVASFRLTISEWDVFNSFYKSNKTGILSKKQIDIEKRHRNEKTGGHAVVLTSFNSECLRFMNSWGTNWGDVGFFRVQKADVLNFKFFDVFWTLNDLNQEEKNYYATHGSEVAARLVRDLKGLQVARYQCPLCGVKSPVTDFTGSLLRAKCPRCLREFRSDEAGNILALNMYLTSLSR